MRGASGLPWVSGKAQSVSCGMAKVGSSLSGSQGKLGMTLFDQGLRVPAKLSE